jgi:putative phosphoribosyl transferase
VRVLTSPRRRPGGPSALAASPGAVNTGRVVMFRDRADAGRQLAVELKRHLGDEDVVVLGLPRGGVPVAFEVARELDAPLDVIVVRKLGVPYQPELGMGAIGEDGVRVLNDDVLARARIGEDEVVAVEQAERVELGRRAMLFRGDRPRASLVGRTAVVVDDGIATGSTAHAACQVVRAHGASRVILAVPVAPRSSLASLAKTADELVCLASPEPFFSVGQFYQDFSQTSDEEVVEFLERAATGAFTAPVAARTTDDPPVRDEDVTVEIRAVRLVGHLTVPEVCSGLVVFAHGSGSSRHSPRNRFVAAVLNSAGLGTLLFDLLTPDEEIQRSAVFDIELLADRLGSVTEWLEAQPEAKGLCIGYFGASTGAGAALWAAAGSSSSVAAVVSRGGRPDLAGPKLSQVRAPTLLIVGGRDEVVLELNRQAQEQLECENQLAVVPGATHLFEEPGALEQVSRLAGDWLLSHLSPAAEAAG